MLVAKSLEKAGFTPRFLDRAGEFLAAPDRPRGPRCGPRSARERGRIRRRAPLSSDAGPRERARRTDGITGRRRSAECRCADDDHARRRGRGARGRLHSDPRRRSRHASGDCHPRRLAWRRGGRDRCRDSSRRGRPHLRPRSLHRSVLLRGRSRRRGEDLQRGRRRRPRKAHRRKSLDRPSGERPDSSSVAITCKMQTSRMSPAARSAIGAFTPSGGTGPRVDA